MQNFRNVKAWQKGHLLTLEVYRITQGFPAEERYGLTSQIRRAASSIGANIAEGCGRGSDADFRRLLHYALGSVNEVEYYLLLSSDLSFLRSAEHARLEALVIEVKKMLTALVLKLKSA